MLVLFAAVFSLSGGCGGDTGPDRGNVTGTVTLDGEPLEGATVRFHPETGRPSSGETDSSGKYELRYTIDKPGAMVGSHTVRITTAKELEDGTMTPEQVPARYNSESELTREVEPGENEFDFELES